MKVSVALCTYNGQKHILEQLRSIAEQTQLPEEIILCDDGSTDNTVELAEKFSLDCSIPIRIYVNSITLGITKNFHKAIGLCKGELIALCDQDDFWLPDKLGQMTRFLGQAENSHINVLFSDLQLVDENLNYLPHTMWENIGFTIKHQKEWKRGKAVRVQVRQGNVVTGASVLFRASFREKFLDLLLLKLYRWIHDGIIATVAAKENSIWFLAQPTILYRQHAAQQLGAGTTRIKPAIKKRVASIKETKNSDILLENSIQIAKETGHDLMKIGVDINELSFIDRSILHFERRRKIIRLAKIFRLLPISRELILLRYKKYSHSAFLDSLRDLFHERLS